MGVVIKEDLKYPKLLREIGKESPKQLYYKGEWDEQIFENCLSVVGSRQMTTYGKRAVEQIVGEIASAGITIVSGFMYGIDATAHQAALKVGGKTIAVMPCGIDLIHPDSQKKLYFEILENKGLIVSEYEKDFAPALWTYPKRNRIVAGLSKAVLIVEAALKSGSLITADFAKKFKRKIFVVPGPIFSHNSKGIIELIKQGAEMATGAGEILKFYGVSQKLGNLVSKKETKFPDGSIEGKIIEQLQREPMAIDDLVVFLETPVSKLSTVISLMELKGIIEQDGNKYYVS